MNDRAAELLTQYEMEFAGVCKGRGALRCTAGNKVYIFMEYTGSLHHLALQNKLLQKLSADGIACVEQIVPTKEGELSCVDADGVRYLLKTSVNGRECQVTDRDECLRAVRQLAGLHKHMALPASEAGETVFSPLTEYEKHTRELKRAKKYLQQKRQKQAFEKELLAVCDRFIDRAEEVTQDWSFYARSLAEETKEEVPVCHGDYQYHNLTVANGEFFVSNFEKCIADEPVRDLALLLRKLMEKYEWNAEFGAQLLQAYERERPLFAAEKIDLLYRIKFPEKYWKIVNFYINSGKAFISCRNGEKLRKVLEQEKAKDRFIDTVFAEYLLKIK